MRPGQVSSDEQAFRQIMGRLEQEVGGLIYLISVGKMRKSFTRKPRPSGPS
jgi:hypothetical protein